MESEAFSLLCYSTVNETFDPQTSFLMHHDDSLSFFQMLSSLLIGMQKNSCNHNIRNSTQGAPAYFYFETTYIFSQELMTPDHFTTTYVVQCMHYKLSYKPMQKHYVHVAYMYMDYPR